MRPLQTVATHFGALSLAWTYLTKAEAALIIERGQYCDPEGTRKKRRMPSASMTTDLKFIRLHHAATKIRAAHSSRAWMNNTDKRFANRCTPMLIANAAGWELLTPFAFDVSWNGENGRDSIKITTSAAPDLLQSFIASHFGHGVITFHTGWLIRTSAGLGTWARGIPNLSKHGLSALEGIVETDWLPFPFTMNWRFDAPGTVRFEREEPFCLISPIALQSLQSIAPRIVDISQEEREAKYLDDWSASRTEFNAGLLEENRPQSAEDWQKTYALGSHELTQHHAHLSKLKLNDPIESPMTP